LRELLGRAATPPPQWLTAAKASLDVPRMGSFAYVDLNSVFTLASRIGGVGVEQILNTLGLSAMETWVSATGLDETGLVRRAKLTSSDPGSGLGALASGQPLTASDMEGIPRDASIALALRMDLHRIYEKGIELLTEVQPNAADEVRRGVQRIEEPLGIDIEDDLLASLGDVWTLHTAASSGGLAAGWTLTVRLADAARAEKTHRTLLRVAESAFAQQHRPPRIRRFEHGGKTACMLEVSEKEFFLAPTWCLTDSHLVVTLLPQTMKAYLSQSTASTSLTDHPAVAAALARPNGTCFLSFQDVREHFVMFYPLLQYAAQLAARQLQRQGIDVDTTKLPSIPAVAPHLLPTITATYACDDGFETYTHSTFPSANLSASAPVMVALLLPAVQSAREAARRAQSMNNMKQLGLAVHNYHDTFKGMPAAYSATQDGRPLLSWRVHILPYLDQQPLYEQFHFDEPWDSEHNRGLIEKMPAVYRSPRSKAEAGKTVYLANAGRDGVFVATKDKAKGIKFPVGIRLHDVSDGASNTIMLVKASDSAAVIWTKPDDFELNENNPLQGLIGARSGFFLATLCDGAVRAVSTQIDRATLKGLFTRSGSEKLENWMSF